MISSSSGVPADVAPLRTLSVPLVANWLHRAPNERLVATALAGERIILTFSAKGSARALQSLEFAPSGESTVGRISLGLHHRGC